MQTLFPVTTGHFHSRRRDILSLPVERTGNEVNRPDATLLSKMFDKEVNHSLFYPKLNVLVLHILKVLLPYSTLIHTHSLDLLPVMFPSNCSIVQILMDFKFIPLIRRNQL